MYHYVYCVENLVNGKIYVGKHSTDDLDDGYMGSGKALSRAITKYGLENFRKHIIYECSSSKEAFEIERQLVDETFVSNTNTYNLKVGGRGGCTREHAVKCGSISMKKLWANPEWRAYRLQQMSETNKRMHASGTLVAPSFAGHQHSDEARRKIGAANSQHQKGEGNSQFGKKWVLNLELKQSVKINLEEVEDYLAKGWQLGRKVKWS